MRIKRLNRTKHKYKDKQTIKSNKSNKLSIRNNNKKNKKRTIKRKYKRMKGGMLNNFKLSDVDPERFKINLRTLEHVKNKQICQKHMVVVTDNATNSRFIVDTGCDYIFLLVLFDPDSLDDGTDKVYVYYIDYTDSDNPLNAYEAGEESKIPTEMEIIRADLPLPQIMDTLVNNRDIIGPVYCINLSEYYKHRITSPYIVNIDRAVLRLQELNTILQTRCPSLELKFDYLLNLPGEIVSSYYFKNYLTLCLYHQGSCVASIMCYLKVYPPEPPGGIPPIPNAFEIISETNLSMRDRKFNKLLRAVLIIISNWIRVSNEPTIEQILDDKNDYEDYVRIEHIISQAINPISAWLLINYYNAEIVEQGFLQYMKDEERRQGIPITKPTKKLIQDYMGTTRDINTIIELNPDNIDKAFAEFTNSLSGSDITKLINCENVEESWDTRLSVA